MRIGRIGFALGYTAILAALYWHDSLSTNIFGHVSPRTALVYIVLLCLVASWFLVTLRCHDFNQTIWDNFWTGQAPFIGQIWALGELLLKPGTAGRNSYGAPPFL
jgi:uncharacterized membrane protein YhaH (DUF805 family)